MAVMAREAWTDERLDDLNARVERGFAEVKGEIKDLRMEMNSRFTSIDARFTVIETRFDSMQRMIIVGFITLFASIVASVIGGVFAALALG